MPTRIVCVQGLSETRRIADAAVSKFIHVDLGQDDRAGFAQLTNARRILIRQRVRQHEAAAAGGHVGRVVIVLGEDRNAHQRRAQTLGLAFLVECTRGIERRLVQRDHRVQRRPLLVVSGDPRQVQLRQLFVAERTGTNRILDLLDAGVLQVEGLGIGQRRKAQRQRGSEQHRVQRRFHWEHLQGMTSKRA